MCVGRGIRHGGITNLKVASEHGMGILWIVSRKRWRLGLYAPIQPCWLGGVFPITKRLWLGWALVCWHSRPCKGQWKSQECRAFVYMSNAFTCQHISQLVGSGGLKLSINLEFLKYQCFIEIININAVLHVKISRQLSFELSLDSF